MMLYKNRKAMVSVSVTDGDTDCFDAVAEILQGNTLAPYMFIISLYYIK